MTLTFPDPAGLDVPEIAEQFRQLTAHRRHLLDRLTDIERRGSHGGGEQSDARLELLLLLEYAKALQYRAKQIEHWLPADQMPVVFHRQTGAENQWVAAWADCPLTPDSVLFLHAPVSLFYISRLAESLLAPGDRLAWLRRVSFHRELSSQPRLIIWDLGFGDPPVPVPRKDAAIDGILETAFGRRLAFVALPDPSRPLTRKADYHPMVGEVVRQKPHFDAATGRFRHTLSPGDWPPSTPAIRGASAVFAVAETLITAFGQAVADGQRQYLFMGVIDQPIPADFAAWLAGHPEYAVDMDLNRRRPVPGRGSFLPIQYRIQPDDTGWRRGLVACLDSHLLF